MDAVPTAARVSSASLSPVDRRALVAVGAQFFVNGLILASYLPRLPELRDRAGLTVDQLGFALTAAGVAGVAASLVVGRLIARFGTRLVIIVGGLGLCGALLLMGVAATPATFVLALAGLSFCDLVVDIAMNLQGSWISARRATPVMNRLHGLWSLGTVIGGAAAAQLSALEVPIDRHLPAAAVVLAVIVVTMGRSLLRTDEGTSHDDIECADDDREPIEPGGDESTRGGVSTAGGGGDARWVIVRLAVAGAAAFLLEQSTADWAAIRLTDDLGASSATGALGFVAFTAGMLLGRASGDLAQLRLGPDRLRSGALALAVIGLAIAFLASSAPLALVGFAVGGVGVATLLPRIYDEAAQIPGARRTALAAMTGATRVSALFGPAIIGVLASTSLSVGAAVVIMLSVAATTFVAVTRQSMP